MIKSECAQEVVRALNIDAKRMKRDILKQPHQVPNMSLGDVLEALKKASSPLKEADLREHGFVFCPSQHEGVEYVNFRNIVLAIPNEQVVGR